MRKKSHAFSDAIGQKPTLIIYTPGVVFPCKASKNNAIGYSK